MGKLVVIYGINAVGKDTIANEFVKFFNNSFITSEQRILMYNLGIIDSFDSHRKISRGNYKSLEGTSVSKLRSVYSFDFFNTLKKLKLEYKFVFLFSHLVVALYLDKKIRYLNLYDVDKMMPDTLFNIADGIINVKANFNDILERRVMDLKLLKRERVTNLKDIEYHQQLCDDVWKKLVSKNKHIRTIVIHNNNGKLGEAVVQAKQFISLL